MEPKKKFSPGTLCALAPAKLVDLHQETAGLQMILKLTEHGMFALFPECFCAGIV